MTVFFFKILSRSSNIYMCILQINIIAYLKVLHILNSENDYSNVREKNEFLIHTIIDDTFLR